MTRSTPQHIVDANRAAGHTRKNPGAPAPNLPRSEPVRVEFGKTITLRGWPSRGGVIVLDRAGIPDFEYLGLDRLYPQIHRADDQRAEDEFCQKLLRLGATWFDSYDRFGFVTDLMGGDVEFRGPAMLALMRGEKPPPSEREGRWVCVGIVEGGGGGFWLWECEQRMPHPTEVYHDEMPTEVAQLRLAKTMEERCIMLEDMGAEFYRCASEYEGLACVNAWETRKVPEHEGWVPDQDKVEKVMPLGPPEPRTAVGKIMAYFTGA